jgi:hypothetical protein
LFAAFSKEVFQSTIGEDASKFWKIVTDGEVVTLGEYLLFVASYKDSIIAC